jgi:glucokinase
LIAGRKMVEYPVTDTKPKALTEQDAMADKQQTCWLGFDLGGTKMMAALYDAEFRTLARKRKKTKGHEGVDAGLERIVQVVRDVLADAGIGMENVSGIGVGCPGPIDLERGVILDAPNLGWREVPIVRSLEDRLGCPAVIANDVDAGVFAESQFGAGRSAHCVLGVFPGTGIGGGCVYEGQIVRGRVRSCMEIGHVRVLPEGPRCGCGLRGCLEAVASRLAISAAAAKAAYRGQAPRLHELTGADISKIRSGTLAEAIRSGDTVIEEIVCEACRHIGVAIAGVVHLLGPDAVVLGGGLVNAMPDLFVREVGKSAAAHVMPSFRKSFRVLPAELGDEATAMGAAAWARSTLTGDRVPDSYAASARN